MTRSVRIEQTLRDSFAPTDLVVNDDSAMHAGHSGAAAGGETHYQVTMVSPAFTGQNRVARSRAVHDALAAEFKTGLHALSLRLRAPGE